MQRLLSLETLEKEVRLLLGMKAEITETFQFKTKGTLTTPERLRFHKRFQ
jgi:hypothetical protein